MTNRITIKDLAERIGMDRSACRRYVLRLGYKPALMRTAESGFQRALTLAEGEAQAIAKHRASEGYVPQTVIFLNPRTITPLVQHDPFR